MSLDNPVDQIPESVIDGSPGAKGWILKIIQNTKEILWNGFVDELMKWAEDLPIIWPKLAEIWKKSSEDLTALSEDLEGNSISVGLMRGIEKAPEKFHSIIEKVTNITKTPVKYLVWTVNLENSWWDPNIFTGWKTFQQWKNTAFWLGQITKPTHYTDIRPRLLEMHQIDIWEHWVVDPEKQLLAASFHLADIRERKKCSWLEAMAYYHTWTGIENISNKTAQKFADSHPSIAKLMPEGEEVTGKSYFQAAKIYCRNAL